jgi:hypothetical protein
MAKEGWIKIKDQRPKGLEYVLFMTTDSDIYWGQYLGIDAGFKSYDKWGTVWNDVDDVLYWMPLLALPSDIEQKGQ